MLNLRSRFVKAVLVTAAAVLLCSGSLMPAQAFSLCSVLGIGCSDEKPSGQPSFYRSMATADAKVDAKAAQSMISGYRRNNGLGIVVLDDKLMKLAEEQARAMANKNRFEHDAAGPFAQRIKRGYDAKVAVENIGAGYHTLAEAFSGWRDSPPAPGQYAAQRRDQDGDRGGLFAQFQVQGVLGLDPRHAGRSQGITS